MDQYGILRGGEEGKQKTRKLKVQKVMEVEESEEEDEKKMSAKGEKRTTSLRRTYMNALKD